MDLRELRYFVAVAEERHFGRAAVRLHMAQPPLSQAIKRLEADLGVRLLHRTTRQVDLTPAGADYLDRARAILAAVDDAGERARRVADGVVGRLRIGCVGSATYTLLPAFARRLREDLPDVEVAFRGEMLGPAQVEALRAGDLDLGLLRPPPDDAGLALTVLRRDRLVVLLPDGHPLASRARLRPADLRDVDLVVHVAGGRSAMSVVVDDLCGEAGFAPRVRHEVSETSTLVTFVAAGLGAAVVPEPVTALGVPGVVHRPLGTSRRLPLVAGTRAGDDAPALARALRLLAAVSRGPG